MSRPTTMSIILITLVRPLWFTHECGVLSKCSHSICRPATSIHIAHSCIHFPDAFDTSLAVSVLQKLKVGKSVQVSSSQWSLLVSFTNYNCNIFTALISLIIILLSKHGCHALPPHSPCELALQRFFLFDVVIWMTKVVHMHAIVCGALYPHPNMYIDLLILLFVVPGSYL